MLRFSNRRSFTLIELLVVLALVAILSVVVILTLNPAELLKQGRDSTRLSDLGTVNTALSAFNADVNAGFMGTSSIVYVSIPDTTSTCANLGLPTLPSPWSYNCVTATSTKLSNGNGWIPVNFNLISFGAPLSNLPIDPTNTTSSYQYYTYTNGGSTWKLQAMTLESQKYSSQTTTDGGVADTSYEAGSGLTLASTIFPAGWIKVPGNGTFGTSNFYVMKYNAKCADTSNTPLISPDTGSGYQTYANNTTPCTSANSRYVTSAAGGYPIANIAQTTSITYCQNIGAHLITNNEYQTIAWNAQNNSANWRNGVIGSTEAGGGGIYRGHSDNVPPSALVASTDDTQGYYGETNTGGTQKRTLVLSNGSTIWDMAGNVWQWTNDTITGTNQPYAPTAGFAWREFSAITNWGTMTQQTAGGVNSAWNSTNGIGQIYSDGSVNATTYAFLRGGAWDIGTVAGVETLYLVGGPGDTSNYFGFRCAR